MNRFSFRPQLESLDGRCLPSGNPAFSISDVALVGSNNIRDHSEALRSQKEAEEVTLTLTVDLDAGTRTWTAAGAIEDSGTATTVWIHFGAINSPTVSILQIDTRFTNADGTGSFTIRRSIVSMSDGDEFAREGTWHIVDATGIYGGLKGHGKLTGLESGASVVDTLSGVLMNAD